MPDLAAEIWAVQHLAALCGMNVTNIRDAKTALGPVERGLDFVFDLDCQSALNSFQQTAFKSFHFFGRLMAAVCAV